MLELASEYQAKEQIPEAIRILERFPENAAARERLGELQLVSGKAAEAIASLEEAVKTSPTVANRYALGFAYLRNKQLDKAEAVLAPAAAAEPKDFDLRMTYGRVLRDLKRYVPAAREFQAAVQVKPDSVEAWNEFAGMLIITENYEPALAALDRLRAMGAESVSHHYFRAIMLDRMKQFKPALESYQKFLAASEGKFPDEEFKSRQRVRIIEKELSRR
jgi:tetratricopeptide (TPR) repeat protein